MYLGDGVYVNLVRGMFCLTTEYGDGPTNTIYLEPEVYDAFKEYAESMFKKHEKQKPLESSDPKG